MIADTRGVKIRQHLTLIVGSLAACVMVGLVAVYLVSTDRASSDKIRQELSSRAASAGALTYGAFTASDRQNRSTAAQMFSGDARSVQAALDADESLKFSAVMTTDGTVLGARPAGLRRTAAQALVAPVVKSALEQSKMVFGDLTQGPDGQLFPVGIPFSSAGQQRIWILSVPIETINSFAEGYLSASLGLRNARAFIVDGNGLIVARTGSEQLGSPIPDQRLAAALRRSGSGMSGTDYYASADVPETAWRVVFVTPERVLYEPVQASRRIAWQMFAAFVFALMCVTALGFTVLARSNRLAHERLHDALTGLPNRTLFVQRVEQAIANRQKAHSNVAVLFLDLDGFKLINDVHGHAAGDELLSEVARRLVSSGRQGDVFSRFGGDEFLVLCTGLSETQQVAAVAERFRRRLTEPYEIAGTMVSVGCSIGVAVSDGDTNTSSSLIHEADLAMYSAKKDRRRNAILIPADTAQ